MTSPVKPHSRRSTFCSSHGCCEQYGPFRRLYAVMIAHGRASFTTISKGRRYSSRSVRSSITESIVPRWNSDSFPAKCFGVAPTPPACRPWMYAAASRPVRTGSSA